MTAVKKANRVTKFSGGFAVEGDHHNAIYVTPSHLRVDSLTVQAGVGLCVVPREDFVAFCKAVVEKFGT